jgi:hypothetical protein
VPWIGARATRTTVGGVDGEVRRWEEVWGFLSLAAVIVGLIATLFGSPVLLAGHEADCQGTAMEPGDRCGDIMQMQVDPDAGRSYDEVRAETSLRRNIGYAGVALLVSGIASTATVMIRAWRRNRDRDAAFLLGRHLPPPPD